MAIADRIEIFDVKIEKFYRAVADFDAYSLFVTGVKVARVLTPGVLNPWNSEMDVQMQMEIVKRLDYEIRAKRFFNFEKGVAEVSWTLLKSKEMKVNNGKWVMRRVNPFQTEVRYELELDLSFSVPSFVMKGLLGKSLPQAMKEFSERARLVEAFPDAQM
jgi:ribosome-associated toxin RatA of RatAB toxin-antitoxin module